VVRSRDHKAELGHVTLVLAHDWLQTEMDAIPLVQETEHP